MEAENIRSKEHINREPGAVGTLFEKVIQFGKTTWDLALLKTLEKSSRVLSALMTRLVIGILLFFFVTSLNIGLALLVGEALGRYYYGFFVMSGFYLIVGIAFRVFLYKRVRRLLEDFIIKQTFQ